VGGWGVTVGGWGVTVGDWGVTVEGVATVVDITVGEIGVMGGTMVFTVEGWFITVVGAWWGGSATMVFTVEGWFITVVGAWWGGSAEQGGQTQPPTSPWKNMDLRVGPGSPGQAEWTHLLQWLH